MGGKLFKVINMERNIHAMMKYTDNFDMAFCDEIKNNVSSCQKSAKVWYYVIN